MNDDGWRSRLIEKPRWHVGVERRSCRLHPAIRAVDRCDHCGEPFCAACLQQVERWRVCAACIHQFQREEHASRLPERLRRLGGQALTVVGIVLVLALVTFGLQTLLRGASSNAAMLQSAQIVGNKLQGAPAPPPATMDVQGTLTAAHPPATLVLMGRGFRPGELVKVSAEVDGLGAIIGPTERGQEGVTALGVVTATVARDGAISAHFAVPDADTLPVPYRIQVHAKGNRGTTADLDLHPGGL